MRSRRTRPPSASWRRTWTRASFAARLAAAEKELEAFERGEARTRIADLERQIKDVRADERIEALEKQIRDIHADDRIAEIEHRLKPIVERLKAQVVRLAS